MALYQMTKFPTASLALHTRVRSNKGRTSSGTSLTETVCGGIPTCSLVHVYITSLIPACENMLLHTVLLTSHVVFALKFLSVNLPKPHVIEHSPTPKRMQL